jgi:recombinational DNA repair protein (RecF pathway)
MPGAPMQGYILNIVKVKEEDLIVTLLTQKRLKTLYRFYGARHANIHMGYKIDFEEQFRPKSTISMLRNVLHLSSPWIINPKKFYIWQQFIKLLYQHLRDIEEVDTFYFELLDELNYKFAKQNTKRSIVEAYIKILAYEGRLHDDFHCFICDGEIENDLILTRGFLPAHQRCLFGAILDKSKIEILFATQKTLFLSDDEVDFLWRIIEEGL